MVTRPIVHYLSDNGFKVILGSRTKENVDKLIDGAKNAEGRVLDVEKEDDVKKVEELVAKVDGVVSLLPYIYHPKMAELAIKHKKHFFTASYVSDTMRKMEEDAKKAGILMINECGVDPGTDHMSAMRVIHDVRKRGGYVTSFYSICGGLPAPESNNNPLGYKFSWAPRGVLLASRNDAKFYKDGKEVVIPGKDLFDNYETEEVGDMGTYESYPNRDSTAYKSIYGLDKIQTMMRGTYRNVGWCRTIKKLADLGYLSLDEVDLKGKSYSDVLKAKINSSGELKADLAKHLSIQPDDGVIKNMEWLGLLSDEKIPDGTNTVLDALCASMMKRMQYKEGEKDMILMRHTFIAEFPERKEKETITSTLVAIGNEKDTAMAITVALPLAIAIKAVFAGKITGTGIKIPIEPEIYNPILDELEESFKIKFVEKIEKVEKM